MADEEGAAAPAVAAPVTPPADDAAGTLLAGKPDAKPDGKPSDGAPEAYADFTVPEGFTLDKPLLDKFVPLARELGLTQAKAQKVATLYSEAVQGLLAQQQQDWSKQVADWGKAAALDTEFGGQGFETNVKLAKAALEKFGTPELAQLVEDMGLGNNPEYIRFAYRVAKALGEDKLVMPSAPGARDTHAAVDTDIGNKWYPKSNPSGS